MEPRPKILELDEDHWPTPAVKRTLTMVSSTQDEERPPTTPAIVGRKGGPREGKGAPGERPRGSVPSLRSTYMGALFKLGMMSTG